MIPKVSVCIPAYNYGKYLKGCLDSVFAQTYEDFEIVLVDNASTDETSEIVRTYKDPRLRYLRNAYTISSVDNHNKAFSLARGEYIALLAADDEFLSDRLLRGVEALDCYPRVGLVYSAVVIIDAEGKALRTVRPHPTDRIISGKQEFVHLVQENYIACPTVMFRNALCRELGGFRTVRYTPDWDMWLRCTFKGDVAYFAAPLARYRVHGESETAEYTRQGQVDLDLAWTVQAAFEELPSDFRDLMYLRKQVLPRYCLPAAWRAFEMGDKGKAQEYLSTAIEVDPDLLHDTERFIDSIVDFSVGRLVSQVPPLKFAEALCDWLNLFSPNYAKIQRPVLAGIHAALAFQARDKGQMKSVRHHAICAITGNPIWLRNRGLLSITLESIIGRRLMEGVRRVI